MEEIDKSAQQDPATAGSYTCSRTLHQQSQRAEVLASLGMLHAPGAAKMPKT